MYIPNSPCMLVYNKWFSVNKGKGSRVSLISQISNRINNISNHTRRIYDLHCLFNILVAKILKIKIKIEIKVCNPSPFRKTCFVTSLTNKYHACDI